MGTATTPAATLSDISYTDVLGAVEARKGAFTADTGYETTIESNAGQRSVRISQEDGWTCVIYANGTRWDWIAEDAQGASNEGSLDSRAPRATINWLMS